MDERGTVLEVCLSSRKGEPKKPIGQGRLVQDHGLEGDAHAGTERQVSLLCEESAEKIRRKGLDVGPGDFAENILLGGLSPEQFRPGVRLRILGTASGAGALLEVTQIGKECHEDCAIKEQTGECVMPREGVFARVVEGGVVCAGNAVELLPPGAGPRASGRSSK